MSSASSAVTYTSVYTVSEPGIVFWGADKEISDGGSPRVIVYGYDGLPMQPVVPPSPDYVPGPEHPPSPDYVPGPKHPPSPVEIPYIPEPEYLDYVPDSNLEEDSEEEHADYPADGGDRDDEPSDDDDDDDDDTDDEDEEPFKDEDDDEEEEEHLALADSFAVPIADLVPSARDTEAFKIDESAPTPRSPQTMVPFAQTCLRRARKTVRLEPPMSPSMVARIVEHAAALTPPLLVASPPLPLPSPLTTSPTDAGAPLGYRAARIQMRATTASPPLLLPSTSHMTDIPKAEMPPWKRPCRTEEFQVRFEEAYNDRAYLRARVNTLFRDRPYHCHIALALDREAVYARIAWNSSEEKRTSIEAHVQTLEAHVATLIAQTTSLQTQLTTALGHIKTLEARDPEPQDGPVEAGSSC
ncbi:hypothetical protein Tco_0960051 [Tanacetum coccineum]